MDLLEKGKILTEEIKSSPKYKELLENSNQDHIKGYFTEIETVNDNFDFLELYRYIQYWKLPYKQTLIDYASQPNYSPKSLIENMSLTGKDSYFSFFKTLIENAQYKPSTIYPIGDIEVDYKTLVYLNRADLVEKLFNDGVPFKDIYLDVKYGNSTLEVVSRMLELDYCPDDDVIMWYISQGMGKLVEVMAPNAYDPEFVFSEIPVDLDTYHVMIDTINQGVEIDEDKAEIILNRMISDPSFDCLKIDVALFIKLYRKCQSKMSAEYKKIILKLVSEKNQSFLTYSILKEFDEEFKSNSDCVKLNPITITNFIVDNIKDAKTYIIFFVQILEKSNYDAIYDVAYDIQEDDEIQNNYEISSIDYANMYNENFGEDSSDDEFSSRDFISDEYSEYQKRYHHDNHCNVQDENDLIEAVGNMSLYKIIDSESRGNTGQYEYVRKTWYDEDSDEE